MLKCSHWYKKCKFFDKRAQLDLEIQIHYFLKNWETDMVVSNFRVIELNPDASKVVMLTI